MRMKKAVILPCISKKALFLSFLIVVLSAALATSPVFGGNDGEDKAEKARQKHTEKLLENPNVIGVGLAVKPNRKRVIKVFTLKKEDEEHKVPKKLDGVDVETEVTGMIVARACPLPTSRCDRPVPIGVSTGHPSITAGTIGARVTDGTDFFALSNNHVYANGNNASIGDAVIQPGVVDGGSSPADDIGALDAYKTIVFDNPSANNTMDAAMAKVAFKDFDGDGSSEWGVGNATLPGGYGTPSSAIFGDGDGDGFFDNKNDLLEVWPETSIPPRPAFS